MSYPTSCSCGTCPKCRQREYARKSRAKKTPSILVKRNGKGLFKLDSEHVPEDLSYLYGPSYPGSTLDPKRIFIFKEEKAK